MINSKTMSFEDANKALTEFDLNYKQKLYAIAEHFGIRTHGQNILLDRDTEGEYHISNTYTYTHSKKIEGFKTYTSPYGVIDEVFKKVSKRNREIGAKNAK